MKRKTLLFTLALLTLALQGIGQVAIGNLRYTFSGSEATVVGFNTEPTGALTIPATVTYNGNTYTVTTIGKRAFGSCYALTSVSMPSVTTIGERAFGSCYALTSVSMPSVTTIGKYAFYYCDALTSVSMPSVTTIDEYAFYNCRALPNVSMPNVTTIGEHAFYDCEALTSVSMPKVKIIKTSGFYYSGIQNIGEIPNIEEIHYQAFYHTPLEKITIPMNIRYLGPACLRTGEANTIIVVEDAAEIYEQGVIGESNGTTGSIRFGSLFGDFTLKLRKPVRMIVPEGKAALIINKWHINNDDFEIYSPVTINKTNSGYSTLCITEDNPAASFTYQGVKYENHYDFNFALDEATCYNNIPNNPYQLRTYDYKWYAATSYVDKNVQEGTLTLTQQSSDNQFANNSTGVKSGDGFILKGPAVNKVYAPVHYLSNTGEVYNQLQQQHPDWNEYQTLVEKERNSGLTTAEENRYWELVSFFSDDETGIFHPQAYEQTTYNILKYEGTNYFKAGTGTAVAKESDGNYNFYFSGSMQAFYPCNNTVIPTDKAYLSLPKSMTANAKQITFVIDDNETTGIVDLNNDRYTMDDDGNLVPYRDSDTWHTLNGIRLNGKPTQKGIYLHNGRKEVVR